ncbi:molybdopterin-dependent oxidoreductase [Deinococcus navajonensis]|uniref:Molybdopterin-dependent oxidoreductase n=1 Tax=Deinococcus navajonensis TaxID=309884 RepID=A0ABV8XQF4_9DEIO
MLPPNPGLRSAVLVALLGALLVQGGLAQSGAQEKKPGPGGSRTALQAALRPTKPPRRAESMPPPLGGFPYLRPAQPRPAAAPGAPALLITEVGTRRQTYTLAQLQALPALRYETYHPQLQKSFVYEGVPLRDLASAMGVLGRDLRVYAANGYVATIRAQDYENEALMLAYRADGKVISVMQKGPLTIVLPPDDRRFPPREYGYAWVWWVDRITPAP